MFCPKCGKEIGSEISFCTDCGADLRRKCVRCGAELAIGAKFCPKCGSAQDGTQAQPQSPHSQPVSGEPKPSFGAAIASCFSHFFDFKGRAHSREFWYFTLFAVIVEVAAQWCLIDFVNRSLQYKKRLLPWLSISSLEHLDSAILKFVIPAAFLCLFIPWLAVLVRSLRNRKAKAYEQHSPSNPPNHQTQARQSFAPQKKGGVGKIIGGIAVAVGLIFIVLVVANQNGSSGHSSSYTATQNSYAKIESDELGVMDDIEWGLSAVYVTLGTFGKTIAPENYTKADKDALRYASNYVRSHYTLQANGVYGVSLYKYYNSETDYSMWSIFLRYSRINDDFSAFLGRTD